MKPTLLSKVETSRLAAKALFEADTRRGLAADLRRDLERLGRLAKAWADGRYRTIPWRALAMATGAILYFLNPLDAIPDFLVGVGYLDDATVLAMVAGTLRDELRRFAEWEQAAELTTD